MQIGFDISQTGSGKAGCGYFAHAMLRAMMEVAPEHRYALFPSFGDFYFDARMPSTCPYSAPHVMYGPRHGTREAAARFWNDVGLQAALRDLDVVHSNNFWTPTTLSSSRLVYTFYDMGFVVDPGWTTEANRIGCFEGVFRAAAAADWVVAISHYSRGHFLDNFPHFPAERVRVVHPCSRFDAAAATGSRPASLDPRIRPGAFWLSVGTIEPRKNQVRLCEAYARYLAQGGNPMPLVLAGGSGWLMDGFEPLLDAMGLAGRVVLTGYVSDDELVWLYRNCYANLYPSLFEGFGLPVLEGMQFGAPTLASRGTSIPEVAGDAAVLMAPEDTEAWTHAMLGLALDPGQRNTLRERALRRAASFSWKQSAETLLDLYGEAASRPKRVTEGRAG